MRLSRSRWICKVALLVSSQLLAVVAHGHGEQHSEDGPAQILAPGYAELSFSAPEVGTYALPVLGAAGDGEVLASDGEPANLKNLLGQKPTLLSFIYTSCDDVNGCPLATFVLSQVNKRIEMEPTLRGNVRFISLSFDPERDSPSVMNSYGKSFRDGDSDWHFITTVGEKRLTPILEQYNQTVTKEIDTDGKTTSRYSHILRVYLIDTERHIRNIYSVSFLHADTIINDLKTLMTTNTAVEGRTLGSASSKLHGAGDNKTGYEELGYETRSGHLPNRVGHARDLLDFATPSPLGLPALELPKDNPLSTEKVSLGRKIFFDRRLSLNQTLSCAMCHVPEQGFTHNELATAVGLEGRTVRRNSPTIYNVGYMQKLFHDARDDRLEHQVWQPLLAKNEMANPSVSAVVNRLRDLPDYAGLFEKAFEGAAADLVNIGMAIASYERTLISANSSFDRWHFGGEADAVDESVKRGFELFTGKGRCSSCHLLNTDHALFTDHQLHNTGVGYARSMASPPTTAQPVLLAPGIIIEVEPNAVRDSSERPPADLGYYEITQNPIDRWKYRTPSLRNVDLTAPYMHDGSLRSLEAVVDFYNRGGVDNELLDSTIGPLDLTEQEATDLVSLLKSLTGDNVDQILGDAFNAPVGNSN
ncbi:MAG: cytochrome c peroxidase [Gammaproteobacteria bacterium]|jgi:cytochrome c peroxidase